MAAKRCSLCGHNWPNHSDFSRCPDCGEPTSHFSDAEPHVDLTEARRLKAHADFATWCEENGRE